MDNLEDIQDMSECQTACEYLTNCTFFVYDSTESVCKVNTDIENRVCDIIHGTADPTLESCETADKLPWNRVSRRYSYLKIFNTSQNHKIMCHRRF